MTADNDSLPPLSKEESEQIEKEARDRMHSEWPDNKGQQEYGYSCYIAGATLERRRAKAREDEIRLHFGR